MATRHERPAMDLSSQRLATDKIYGWLAGMRAMQRGMAIGRTRPWTWEPHLKPNALPLGKNKQSSHAQSRPLNTSWRQQTSLSSRASWALVLPMYSEQHHAAVGAVPRSNSDHLWRPACKISQIFWIQEETQEPKTLNTLSTSLGIGSH